MQPSDDALKIWQAAVDAVKPGPLVRQALTDSAHGIPAVLAKSRRILVLGGGKAGAAMAAAVEEVLHGQLSQLEGIVNVPAESVICLQKIRLNAARPAGSNQPTPEGVWGAEQILSLARTASPEDVGLCLISGGASALLPRLLPESASATSKPSPNCCMRAEQPSTR